MHRAEDARQHLLGLGPTGGAIPAADFARDHGGPQRVFGAPIGGVDGVGLEQKREHRWKLDGEMRGEIARDAASARPIDEGIELIVQMTTGHGEAMGRDGAAPIAIADAQRALEHALHPRSEMRVAMIADQCATAPQQMGEARLVDRLIEAPIGRPAVAHERAGKVGAQDRGRLLEAAPGQNGIDGRVGRGEGPEPLQVAADFPAGFIGTDHVTVAHVRPQRGIGRPRAIGGPMQRVDESPRRNVQPKSIAKQGTDFPDWQPQVRVQNGGEGDGVWAELRRRRAQGIGRLQRMAPLHATATRATAANLDGEGAHDRPHHREIFLVLTRRPGAAQRTPTLRTGIGQGGPMVRVDMCRNRSMGLAAIRAACSPTGSSWCARRRTARERGRLPVHLATSIVQQVFESVDLLAERVPLLAVPVAVAIRPLVLAPQSLDLALLALQLRDQLLTRRGLPPRLHASVMPRLPTKYKKERMNGARRRPPLRSVTR